MTNATGSVEGGEQINESDWYCLDCASYFRQFQAEREREDDWIKGEVSE